VELSLRYSTVRAQLRRAVANRERPLNVLRMLRYALLQGPWRPWLVRHYQTHERRPALPVHAESLIEGLDVDATLRRLDDEAYAMGFVVPPSIVDAITAFGRAAGRKRIDLPHLECEAVRRIAHDPVIVEVARRFLGAEPMLCDSKLQWTMPPADAAGRQRAANEGGLFHYDVADVRALTVFIYLTDVDERCGPHIVIRGTQERRTFSQIFRRFISDEYAQRRYGDRITVITGPRGLGWFEDIACYHKQAPGEQVRLLLTLIYTLHRRPLEEERLAVSAASSRR
jgi:hypothetical protein